MISKILIFWSSLGNNQPEKMLENNGYRILKAFCCASHLPFSYRSKRMLMSPREGAEAVESAGDTWGSLR